MQRLYKTLIQSVIFVPALRSLWLFLIIDIDMILKLRRPTEPSLRFTFDF
jgi:hypothetical protein